MSLKLELNRQHLFKIPRCNIALFLEKVNERDSGRTWKAEAKWIFENGSCYDVIINEYGSYPYMWDKLAEYAKEMGG